MTGRPFGRTSPLRLSCAAAVLAAAQLAAGAPALAQGFRGTALTTVRYVEIRPIVQDTVSRSRVTQLPDGTFEFEGGRVFCIETLRCVYYRSLPVDHAVALTQDVDVSAWGLGVPGLSLTAAVRARAKLAGEFVWPRTEDAFDAILAYAEYDREPFRFRLGRQRTLGGLGFSGYDGASIFFEATPRIDLELYGGRSLARALYEPRRDALRGFEDFLPDRDAYLIGGWTEVEPIDGTRLALRYQREIWSDRSALLSERASLDVRSDRFAPVSLQAGADYDFAFGRVGKAHITARLPISTFTVEATGRRYLPYFELWTIWGFFSPTPYHEIETQVAWSPRPAISVWAGAGYRRYEDAQAPIVFGRLVDDSKRLQAGATYLTSNGLALSAEYVIERGFGAFLNSGDLSMHWQPRERVSLTVGGSAFQQIEQFRIGNGVVLGAMASGEVEISSRVALSAGGSLYRQTFDNRSSTADWNQRRGWASLRVGFGSDPGLRPLR